MALVEYGDSSQSQSFPDILGWALWSCLHYLSLIYRGLHEFKSIFTQKFPEKFFHYKRFNMKLVPAIHNGIKLDGYWVHPKDGTIWSTKQNTIRLIRGSNHLGYRRTNFMIGKEKINLLLHRIVACTLIPFSAPAGVTKKDWNITPQSIKDIIMSQWLINHIDHNRANHHPSNLEWATHTENANASVKHHGSKK